jgi:predicted site-specific integrase-resolvase
MSTYTVSEFSKIVGVSVNTLQRWDREGRLKPNRTPSNRRIYTDKDVSLALGSKLSQADRKIVGYVRVSSQAQKPDMENQARTLTSFCIASGISVNEWVKEVGGGLNFSRPKFTKIIDGIVTGRIECLVVAHKDRLSRFGFELIQHLCDTHDCRLVVMDNESVSPEQEMIQDMLAIVHCFSARLYGLRNYRKALQKALQHDTSAQDTDEPNS